jgi:16S rRNA (uracil1498-N3)-methyltransferase
MALQHSLDFPMRRFFVEEIPEQCRTLVIKGSEARHITRVLRMKAGDRLVLTDRKGARFQSRIELVRKQEVTVLLEKPVPAPPEAEVEMILCQALLKAKAMDFVIQKASELGVHQILPFSSERTVVQAADDKPNRIRHWREIAVNASMQSNRSCPPRVAPPCSLHTVIEQLKDKIALKVVLWEDEKSQDLKSFLRGSPPLKTIAGVIGPEGGFSTEEVDRFRQGGFTSVSLGHRILRAETAAVALLSILQYEWGDLSKTA